MEQNITKGKGTAAVKLVFQLTPVYEQLRLFSTMIEGLVLSGLPTLTSIKLNVLPLVKKKYSAKSLEIYNLCRKHFMTRRWKIGKK